MKDWFTIDKIDENSYIISEYQHWEETHCYLLNGETQSLLIDTGLGIANIYEVVRKLTDKPIIAIATHAHWDHIGGLHLFPNFYVHQALDIKPEIVNRMTIALTELAVLDKLHHGSGTYDYCDWSIKL